MPMFTFVLFDQIIGHIKQSEKIFLLKVSHETIINAFYCELLMFTFLLFDQIIGLTKKDENDLFITHKRIQVPLGRALQLTPYMLLAVFHPAQL